MRRNRSPLTFGARARQASPRSRQAGACEARRRACARKVARAGCRASGQRRARCHLAGSEGRDRRIREHP